MAKSMPGRMTAEVEGEFVVFLVGMWINRWWKIHRWLPVLWAMAPMMRELHRAPERGLLAAHNWLGPRGPMVVQYWRSAAQLEEFARDAALPHHPAWRAFNRSAGNRAGDVGVWHETYVVNAGQWESIYVNAPRFGLAQAGEHLPVGAKGQSAHERRTVR